MASLMAAAFTGLMTNDNSRNQTTLVVDGTCETGRRVAQRPTALDVVVRIGSGSGGLPCDWPDRATWAGALDRVGSVYLSHYPDIAVPDAVDTIGAFARLAVGRGVPRLVLLAGRGVPDAELAEQALRDCGAEPTTMRSTGFSQNFSEDYLLDPAIASAVQR
jgi:uncharacterized protein YbjT (DUF2867 family)